MAYVYTHIREDTNEVFYVGIGSDKYFFRAKDKSRRNRYWCNITNLSSWKFEIVYNNISYEEAKEKEINLISFYKRKNDGGTLCNMTLGGEGSLGLVPVNVRKCFGLSPANEIIEFNSLADAARHIGETGNSNISACIKGKVRKIKGWRFSNNKKDLAEPIRPCLNGKHKNHHTTEIFGSNMINFEIKKFISLKEAAQFLKMKSTINISFVLSNRQKYTKNWVFSYNEDDLFIKRELAIKSKIEHRAKIVFNKKQNKGK